MPWSWFTGGNPRPRVILRCSTCKSQKIRRLYSRPLGRHAEERHYVCVRCGTHGTKVFPRSRDDCSRW
jgi:hypothetical protein